MTQENKLREALADLEHKQWNSICSYIVATLRPLFGPEHRALKYSGEDVRIAHLCLAGWKRQERTPYADLTEKEKDSDREWADKAIEIMSQTGRLGMRDLLQIPIDEDVDATVDAMVERHCRESRERRKAEASDN